MGLVLVSAVCLLELLVSCAGSRAGGIGRSGGGLCVGRDRVAAFRAFGDVALCIEGERLRARINVDSPGPDSFICTILNPIGGVVAELCAGPESVVVDMEDRVRRLSRSDTLALGAYLSGYPFTFDDLIRILSGRPYDAAIFCRVPDSTAMDGRERVEIWSRGRVAVSAVSRGRSGRVSKLVYAGTVPTPWTIVQGRFKGAVASETHLELNRINYFTVSYDRVTVVHD